MALGVRSSDIGLENDMLSFNPNLWLTMRSPSKTAAVHYSVLKEALFL